MSDSITSNCRAFFTRVLLLPFAAVMLADAKEDPALSDQPVAVNQVGYVTERPKRFTAPLAPDGSEFALCVAASGEEIMRGRIEGGIGDFSSYRPSDSSRHYVIEVGGGEVARGVSDPFLIRTGLLHEQFWQPAVDFLIDSRSVIGTHPSAYGACPWRDGTYYDAILPALVLFHLADPARGQTMPKQIDWAADKARVEDPEFKYVDSEWKCEGALDSTRAYFQLPPPAADAPDVIKMIHWGTGYYLKKPDTHDPSMDPAGKKIHSQTLEQLAYVLWAWPTMEQWLPRELYERIRNLCFEHWEESGALGIPEMWDPKTYINPEQMNPRRLHPYKGRHAPGHSIVPNLLMHEVAKREGRDDAEKKARLEQLATAAVDHIFGRNPRLAASPSRPEMGFPEIERGWPKQYAENICARLELSRGSISSAPGTEMFPFNPKGEYRHLEGWVNYGASWCISLAYLHFDAAKTTP